MSILTELHQAHRERQERLAAAGVRDHGINLKNGRPCAPVVAVPVDRAPLVPPGNRIELVPAAGFTSFRVGRGNLIAHAAALEFASGPTPYDLLYLHGGPGLGKTHLLRAIADAGARYFTANEFAFWHKDCRDLRFIAIDNLDARCAGLIANLPFNTRVAVAASEPPREIAGNDGRARSRLEGGLVVEITPPDPALRRAILEQRIQAERNRNGSFSVSPADIDHIAEAVTASVRALEGVVHQLAAHHAVGIPITSELVTQVIDGLALPPPPRIRIEALQRKIARAYNVSHADMLSVRRTSHVVRPRQIAMYLAKKLTLKSLPEIGRRFGGRDHTTVLHAVRKIEGLRAADPALAAELDALERDLGDPS